MKSVVATVALVLVTGAILSPVFGNDFVFDDQKVIVDGDYLHDAGRIPEFFTHPTMYVNPVQRGQVRQVDTYRPVTLITFVWDSALSGRTPWAYHLTNLLAHLLTVVLVVLLGRELFGTAKWKRALAAATFFALTPLPAAAHIWINGRSDVFCALFGLGGILLWRRALAAPEGVRARRFILHTLGALLFLLGLLSKEVLLLTLPALALWPSSAPVPFRRRAIQCSGFVGAAAAYLVARTLAIGGMRSHEDTAQLTKAALHLPALLWDGLSQAVVPTRVHLRFLNYDYAQLEGWHFAGLALLTIVAALGLWRARKAAPVVSWGMLWFVSTLAPVAVITTMLWPGFGRYLYLPGVGLALALAEGAGLLLERHPNIRRPLLVLGAVYAAALALVLSQWVLAYRTSEALYTGAIEADPELGPAHGWLGMSLVQGERFAEAVGPLSVAHAHSPEDRRYLVHLGEAVTHLGDPVAMERVAEEGIARYEDAGYFHVMLVNLYGEARPELASEHILECLRKNAGDADCGRILTALVTEHPLRETYRGHVRRLLEEPRFREVAAQVQPLLAGLP